MRALMLALVVCVSLLLAAPFAQTETGTLAGRVTDSSGAALPGASVRIVGTPRITLTDAKGEFRFDAVAPGTYEISVSLAGHMRATRRATIKSRETTTVTVAMALAGVAESVTVTSPGVPLETKAPREPAPPNAAAVGEARGAGAPGGVVAGAAGGTVGGIVGGLAAAPPPPPAQPRWFSRDTEAYATIDDNAFRHARQDPLSTFSIDVDTASYSNVRRFLNEGRMPPADAVRTEELINYFRFDYAEPSSDAPFAVTTEIAPCPWNRAHRLALVGLQARRLEAGRVPPRNLVLLIDVSGSMMSSDKLPLVRTALRMFVDTLTARDRVAIVVYAGASGLVLPSTAGNQKERIQHAIARLEAGGSTNGGAGITLAYQIAQSQFVPGGINRVILATDGDFNVGVTDHASLVRLIERKREAGVFLSILGVGTGNLKDATMEQLADKGNGNYSYLDTLHEARKVLVSEAGATLVTVAKDVKIQVEFNPARVRAYRLVGYENRLLRNEDFNDDRKDAGEIGAGHTVTALYEIVPPGAPLDPPQVDPLKYQQPTAATREHSGELMTVKLRYKQRDGAASRLLTVAVRDAAGEMTDNIGFASAVASFGMLLRASEHRGTATYTDIAARARRHRGRDDSGYRAEFVRLVELADALSRQARRD